MRTEPYTHSQLDTDTLALEARMLPHLPPVKLRTLRQRPPHLDFASYVQWQSNLIRQDSDRETA